MEENTEVKAEDVKVSVDSEEENKPGLVEEEEVKKEDGTLDYHNGLKDSVSDLREEIRANDENSFVMINEEDAHSIEGVTEQEREDREIVAKRNDINKRPKIAFIMKIIENFNVIIFIVSLCSVPLY